MSEYRLQIIMSEATYNKLEEAKEKAEATNTAEVVRRAIRYLYKIIVEDQDGSHKLDEKAKEIVEKSEKKAKGERSSRIQVVLPENTVNRLRFIQNEMDASMARTIRVALWKYLEMVEEEYCSLAPTSHARPAIASQAL